MPSAAPNEVDRQLPAGDEIFLDHVAHFVRDAEAAQRALIRCGFAPAPISIQVSPDPAGGTRPTGTGNVTAMFERGYAECCLRPPTRRWRASSTPCSNSTPDCTLRRSQSPTQKRHITGLQGMVFGSRPGPHVASRRFRSRRSDGGVYDCARRTRSHAGRPKSDADAPHRAGGVAEALAYSHPNGAIGLVDIAIAVADVDEAAARFARFTGREARPTSGGAVPVSRSRRCLSRHL